MPLVLAIEPNSVQADTLRHVLSPRADTDVVVVGSTDAAVTALDQRLPDLVLVGALLSSRDEDALIAHLRTLPDAGHLQTLTIPQLRQAASRDARRGLAIFGRRKRRRSDDAAGGCDPTQFGDEVAAYLARACEVKAEIEQHKAAASAPEPPVADRPEPVGSHPSVSAEGPAPQDAPRFTDPGSGLESAPDESEGAQHRAATPGEAGTTGQAETAATLAAELDRVRADAERTLADELAAAEACHSTEIAHLETEAAESRDAATRDAQTAAEVLVGETLAAELDQVRADGKQTLAAELAAAEARHSAEIARLETGAAESRDAATRDAQARAEAQADETLAAGLDQVRADATRTLAAELAAAEARHSAEIARLGTGAAKSRDAATRDAQARAEARADETLAAELDQVRAEAERTQAAELAAAEARHSAEIARLETEARDTSEAATRGPGAGADRDRLPATAASTSISLRPLEPVHRGAGSHTTTDYYSLWRARSAAYAPPVEAAVARPSRVDPRRRRWALSVAATLLILLTNNPNSGSAPRQAPATVEAAGVSPAIGPTSVLDRDGALRAPIPGDTERHDPETPATGDEPETGVSNRAPLSTLVLEIMCVLVVMLLLRVTLFVGEGLVWHGLVVTLGLILLGSVVMRAPWGG